MKKILILSSAMGIGLMLLLASCKKTGPKATLTSGTGGSVTASVSTLVLDISKVNASDTSISFALVDPNFGFSAATSDVLQFDSVGDNWAHPQSVSVNAGEKTVAFSTYDFNTLVLKLGFAADSVSKIQVRLQSTVSDETVYTDPIMLTVTPFSAASSVYVPGAYQGWNPASADSLVSPSSNGIYTGVINFTGSDLTFKITPAKNWNSAYGAGSTAGTVSLSGGNLTAPSDGTFLLTLNTNLLTLTYTTEWSVIGDATAGGWSTDAAMNLDAATGNWYTTITLTSTGTQAIKFRYLESWDTNLGEGASAGVLASGGANIAIPATAAGGDTYYIVMNPTTLTYTLTKQ